MKDNQHEQLFTELRAEYEAPAFTELDDEIGAAIGGGSVVLYDAANFEEDKGKGSLTKYTDTWYVGDKFNDKTSSIIINSGTWRFYDGAGYTGFSKDLKPGKYKWVEAVGITNDTISSFRQIK